MLHLYVFVVRTTTGKMAYNTSAEDPTQALEKMAKQLETTPAELSAILEELYEDGKSLPLEGGKQVVIPKGKLPKEVLLAKPVRVIGITLTNMEGVSAFKDVYGKLENIYSDYERRCGITHHPLDCIPTHIMGDFMRKLYRAVDELREQGAW